MAESLNSGASESNDEVRRDSGWSEEYDRLPLKQRMKLLFAQNRLWQVNSEEGENSNLSAAMNHVVVKEEVDEQCDSQGNPMRLSRSADNMTQKNPKPVTEKNQCVSKEFPVARNLLSENQKNLKSSSKSIILALPPQGYPISPLEHLSRQNKSTNVGNMTITKEKNRASSSKKKFSGSEANIGKRPSSSKTTPLNPAIKIEPLDENETSIYKIRAASLPSDYTVPVKYERDIADDSETDELDHILLSERMKLLSQKVKMPSLEIKGTECPRKAVRSGLDSQPMYQRLLNY